MRFTEIPAASALRVLGVYKRWMSPMLPAACRYTPTCSEYAMEAVAKRGAVVGLSLALLRILRCNPLFKGGFDPVCTIVRPASSALITVSTRHSHDQHGRCN